jgi:hypothetical protein
MPALEKSLRTKLENTVKAARDVAEAGARSSLEQIGVGDADAPKHLPGHEKDLRRRLRIHGRQLGDEPGEKKGTQTIERLVEEVAYEHWHRLLFASFLAENNLLMYPDPDEPVAVTISECEDMAADEGARNGWELAARFAALMLPQIFRVESPVFELQMPPERQQQLEKFIAGLPREVFKTSDSLGWVYQFWQANRKKQINDSEVKIGARQLPAVTQLFTEDYMVDFLLDNTLGGWHAGKNFANDARLNDREKNESEIRDSIALPDCKWEYLRFVNDDHGRWNPAAGTFDGWPKVARELRCLDPCMGSGHFVVAMFERLVALRIAEEEIDVRAAVMGVIRDNLFGLEIDPRCTQIAAFNLALAAWRRIGYCVLPPMNLACSGLAPNTTKEEWLSLANDDEKLIGGMERLYDLFEQAPVLGSLIDPQASGDLLIAGFDELKPLLEKALAQEAKDDTLNEMAVIASGLAKAAEILSGKFTLVATNVPYLGRGKQTQFLMDFCDLTYPNAKADVATCFIERCFALSDANCSAALVTPQNWLSQLGYRDLRKFALHSTEWKILARLGSGAFQTISGEVVNVALMCFTKSVPSQSSAFTGIDVSEKDCIDVKRQELEIGSCLTVAQFEQLKNQDHRISFNTRSSFPPIGTWFSALMGSGAGDRLRFVRNFWEVPCENNEVWEFHQSTPSKTLAYAGREEVILWEMEKGQMFRLAESVKHLNHKAQQWRSGKPNWRKRGITVSLMANLPVTLYTGEIYATKCTALVPKEGNESMLPALWAFCSSSDFGTAARAINPRLAIEVKELLQIPFDSVHWQKVAANLNPQGLPTPFSSDPTQWLFSGHPKDSDNPLQVAVARLTGYIWPRQAGAHFMDCPAVTSDGLDSLTDKDGILCIPPVRGEATAADRLLNLLAKAYGPAWSSDVVPGLLREVGYAGKSLESWLRDGFFQQHCELFLNRPFVWHVWDGLRDGFSALVNYHKLDRKSLESLTYLYLGDWINRQKDDATKRIDGAQERLAAAEQLKKRLELILHGEAPYDIFVRWKPLHEQPIGWNPDINDGVRINIRPFLSVPDVKAKGAGVLRVNPKIKWDKDRGKEPERSKQDYPWFWGWDEKTTDFTGGLEFKGERFNDCHYTLAAKQKARDGQ